MIKRYAELMETTVDDVLEWANGQVHDPLPFYADEFPTIDDRVAAIKGYIKQEVEQNQPTDINQRIRQSIKEGKEK